MLTHLQLKKKKKEKLFSSDYFLYPLAIKGWQGIVGHWLGGQAALTPKFVNVIPQERGEVGTLSY